MYDLRFPFLDGQQRFEAIFESLCLILKFKLALIHNLFFGQVDPEFHLLIFLSFPSKDFLNFIFQEHD